MSTVSSPESRSLDRTFGDVWRAARTPLLVAAGVLLAAIVLAVLAGGGRAGLLDPRAADRSGSKALAVLLREQGVRVELSRTTAATVTAAGTGSTIFVAFPDLLVRSQLDRLDATGADIVLVAPTGEALEVLAPRVRAVDQTDSDARQPACELRAAVRAGRAKVGGVLYDAPGAAQRCYATDGHAALVQLVRDGRRITVLGDPTPLTNDRLDEQGNAALAMNLLGQRPTLVWYLPSLDDVPAGEQKSFYELVPDGVIFGLVMLAVAVVLLALWRARRLGPVVHEPLPVVVRATETVEGRARLYQRGGARDRAADALRRATLTRMRQPLGLPRRADPEAVVDAVVRRTDRTGPDIGALLYGAAPADDAALVRLADALDALEREVRRP
jgi:hypothetical protein